MEEEGWAVVRVWSEEEGRVVVRAWERASSLCLRCSPCLGLWTALGGLGCVARLTGTAMASLLRNIPGV